MPLSFLYSATLEFASWNDLFILSTFGLKESSSASKLRITPGRLSFSIILLFRSFSASSFGPTCISSPVSISVPRNTSLLGNTGHFCGFDSYDIHSSRYHEGLARPHYLHLLSDNVAFLRLLASTFTVSS